MAAGQHPLRIVEGGRVESGDDWVEAYLAPINQAPALLAEPISATYRELNVDLDQAARILWCNHLIGERPIFTPNLLAELGALQAGLRGRYAGSQLLKEEPALPFDYLVWASNEPGVFNLGGDLRLMTHLVRTRDRDRLLQYGSACTRVCHTSADKMGLPITTIALIQGEALGGGFEAALSSDIIIAEESSRCGLPEVLFNLFPGMGAYSFLARRIGAVAAERIIFSGRSYTAQELYDLGIVDQIVPDGTGRDAVRDYVRRGARQMVSRRALYQARRRFSPLSYSEMEDIVRPWVEAALALDERSLKVMERLSRAQDRRQAR